MIYFDISVELSNWEDNVLPHSVKAALSSSALHSRSNCTLHKRPNVKNPPKIRSKKFVKLKDHTYACNSLTNVEYKTHPRKRN